MDQEKYWDRAASKKEFTTPFAMDLFEQYVQRTSRIIDVGCGYGRVSNAVYQAGFEQICGVDYSGKMIERGLALYPHLDLKKDSIPFAFKTNSFDAVILVAVLTCIVETTVQQEMMADIQRILKPGGILYINDFLINHDERNVNRYTAFEEKYNTYGVFELDEGAVLRHHTTDYIDSLTRAFEPLEFEPRVYTTMNKHQSNGFYYIGRLMEK